jgi:predicted RNase H-like HicB family nuclease
MAHGDSQEAAIRNVKEAMALWIDTATEFGDSVPEPKDERLILA